MRTNYLIQKDFIVSLVPLGLGYNAEQFKAVSDSMNFLDFNDYNESVFGVKAGGTKASMVAAVVTQGYVHTGDNFHNWAKAQCAMVYGNPDITFKEMEDWCNAQNPRVPVPDVKFMGTDLTTGNSVCFSLSATPYVVMADAVRASMSFPGAFKKIEVRQKMEDGTFDNAYICADGGILNNYPIDRLSQKAPPGYTAPSVPDEKGQLSKLNVGAFGFTLVTDRTATDPRLTGTPLSRRLQFLRVRDQSKGKSALEKKGENEEAKKNQSLLKQMARVLGKNRLGDTSTSEGDKLKASAFKDETITTYVEGVTKLEFNVSPEKKKLIEASGEMAFLNWFIEHRNPTKNYDDFFKAKHTGSKNDNPYNPDEFKGDAVLDNKDKLEIKLIQKEILAAIKKSTEAREMITDAELTKYTTFVIDFQDELNNIKKISDYLEINQHELTDEVKYKISDFKDPTKNQRLKHLAWQMARLEEKYTYLADDSIKTKISTLVEKRIKRHDENKKDKEKKSQENIGTENITAQIKALLKPKPPETPEPPKDPKAPESKVLALAIFKGQLSNMFDMMRADPTLLNELAKNCNAEQLKDLIDTLARTAKQLEQQGRLFHQNYGRLSKLERKTFKKNFQARFSLYLTTVTDPSLLVAAISQDPKDDGKINYLLKNKYINPLTPDKKGHNALHACVDKGDFETFNKIITQFDCKNLPYDIEGKHILHYAIDKGTPDFIHPLFTNSDTKKWIQDLRKNDPEFQSGSGFGDSLRDHLFRKTDLTNLFVINESLGFTGDKAIESENAEACSKKEKEISGQEEIFQSMLNPEKTVHVFNTYLNNNENLDEKTALRLLTTRLVFTNQDDLNNGKTILELAASDNSKEKRYTDLAKMLLTKCEQNTKNQSKINTQFQAKFRGDKSLLYLAAESGNIGFVALCLKHNSSIDTAGPHECVSALTCAAKNGHIDVVEALMNSGQPYSRALPDSEGKNALHYLASNSNKRIEETPLKYEVSDDLLFKLLTKSSLITANQTKKVDVPDATGNTVLDYLFKSNRLDVIQKITTQSKRWKLNHYFDGLFTPHLSGRKTSLEHLSELAAFSPASGINGFNDLYIHVLKNLSKTNKTRMKQDSQGRTPLHYMAACSKEEISPKDFVDYFQSKKTTFHTSAKCHQRSNVEDNKGNSILRALINNNRGDVIDYLNKNWKGWKLNAIFDLHTIRSDGKSDMQYIQTLSAEEKDKYKEVLEAINNFLPEPMKKDSANKDESKTENPVIHNLVLDESLTSVVIWNKITEAVTVFSPTGFREKEADYKDVTSLRDSSGKTLLRQIIDLDKGNTNHRRAGILAEIAMHFTGNWRLDHYFDLTLRDTGGITDLEYALTNGTKEIKNILIKNLSPTTLLNPSGDSKGKSALHYIAQDDNIEPTLFYKSLIKNKAYLRHTNFQDNDGKTPFRLLIEKNRTDILVDISKHCGRHKTGIWKLNHYFDFKTRRKDGLTDLAFLIAEQKKDKTGSYNALLKVVRKNTNSTLFEMAEKQAQTYLENHYITVAPVTNVDKAINKADKILDSLQRHPAYMNKNSPAYQKLSRLIKGLKIKDQGKVIEEIKGIVKNFDKIKDKEGTGKNSVTGLTPHETFLNLVKLDFEPTDTIEKVFTKWSNVETLKAEYRGTSRNTLYSYLPTMNPGHISKKREEQLKMLSNAIALSLDMAKNNRPGASVNRILETIGYLQAELKQEHHHKPSKFAKMLVKIEKELRECNCFPLDKPQDIQEVKAKGAKSFKVDEEKAKKIASAKKK